MGNPLPRSTTSAASFRVAGAALRHSLHAPGATPMQAAEPWWMETESDSDRDGWMLSYLDILTLLLTLLVVIVAITHAELQKRVVPPSVPETPVTLVTSETATPTPIAPEKSVASTAPNIPMEPAASAPSAASADTIAAVNPVAAGSVEPTASLEGIDSIERMAAIESVASASVAQPPSPPPTESVADADAPNESTPDAAVISKVMKQDPAGNATARAPLAVPTMTASEGHQDRAADDKNSLAALGDTGEMQVQVGERGVMIELGEDVLFTSASASLANQTVPALDALASILAEMPYTVWIEGHTDNTPISTTAFPSNWELSTARATAVTRYLIEHGITPQRLRAVGYGDTQPRSNNDTADGRTHNRRVVFRVEMPPPATP